jgi:hypothetical protein
MHRIIAVVNYQLPFTYFMDTAIAISNAEVVYPHHPMRPYIKLITKY